LNPQQPQSVLFDIFDADSSGTVDVIEFIAGVNTLATGTAEQKAELVFHGIDYDDSGKISKKEFTTYVSKAVNIAKVCIYLTDVLLGLPPPPSSRYSRLS